jgi:aminocarboxymuconate-semialdehyde decarboxylase
MAPHPSASQTIDVHAHILTEETIRLLQREAPKVAPKLSDIDDQFGTLDVAGNVYRHFPRGGWDLERRLQDMAASKVDVQVLSVWPRRLPGCRTSSWPSW